MNPELIRNVAIIAHVDHGKTTLVDKLLRQSGTIADHKQLQERAMDSNDIERERGITILSKCTSVNYESSDGNTYLINIVDTPGHADFGGEVERVLKMVDSVVLLVDSVEGPMPQTRFVLRKSLALGLRPIVVINKIDRDQARPDAVLDMVFDLFVALEAANEQLDFATVYASAKQGYAMYDPADSPDDMAPLFETIIKSAPAPDVKLDGPFCMQCATLAYDSFVGRLAIGRVVEGRLKLGDRVTVCQQAGGEKTERISKLYRFSGLERVETTEVQAGEIVMVAGLPDVLPGDTINQVDNKRRLPAIDIDEPTISMRFMVNTSPFAGKEGKFVTSRQIRDRLGRELEKDVSLRVAYPDDADVFEVSGRGELHLSILIENMRREGFELAVSKPVVIFREGPNGEKTEPVEQVTIECGDDYAGAVINKLNQRRGEMQVMEPSGDGMTRVEFQVPSRGLIGFRNEFLTDTRGTGVLYSVFDHYAPYKGDISGRQNGALVAMENGITTAYSLFTLQDRGSMFVVNAEEVYQGQVIGQNARENELVINPCKRKQLNNMRSSGADDKLLLTPPRIMTLETALEWIDVDELVEVTPKSIRVRKIELDHNRRKRNS
jgi:GTP-binding protein